MCLLTHLADCGGGGLLKVGFLIEGKPILFSRIGILLKTLNRISYRRKKKICTAKLKSIAVAYFLTS